MSLPIAPPARLLLLLREEGPLLDADKRRSPFFPESDADAEADPFDGEWEAEGGTPSFPPIAITEAALAAASAAAAP